MSKQLTIFDALEAVSDNNQPSLTDSVSEHKRQALQRYLNSANKETEFSINKYSPGKRKTEYYRLSYRKGKKIKHVHIRGGNVLSNLVQYRVTRIQQMIDRGTELAKVLAAVADYRRVKKNED